MFRSDFSLKPGVEEAAVPTDGYTFGRWSGNSGYCRQRSGGGATRVCRPSPVTQKVSALLNDQVRFYHHFLNLSIFNLIYF